MIVHSSIPAGVCSWANVLLSGKWLLLFFLESSCFFQNFPVSSGTFQLYLLSYLELTAVKDNWMVGVRGSSCQWQTDCATCVSYKQVEEVKNSRKSGASRTSHFEVFGVLVFYMGWCVGNCLLFLMAAWKNQNPKTHTRLKAQDWKTFGQLNTECVRNLEQQRGMPHFSNPQTFIGANVQSLAIPK